MSVDFSLISTDELLDELSRRASNAMPGLPPVAGPGFVASIAGGAIRATWCPGDGTRYDALAVALPMQAWRHPAGTMLLVGGPAGSPRAMFCQPNGGVLAQSYVEEKINRGLSPICGISGARTTELFAALAGREAYCPGDGMSLPEGDPPIMDVDLLSKCMRGVGP